MPMITSRITSRIPVALLLGLVTVAGGAAEQHDVHVGANITHNSPREDSPGRWRGQICLVGSRNCLDMDRHPPRLCLLAADRCEARPGRIERLGVIY